MIVSFENISPKYLFIVFFISENKYDLTKKEAYYQKKKLIKTPKKKKKKKKPTVSSTDTLYY